MPGLSTPGKCVGLRPHVAREARRRPFRAQFGLGEVFRVVAEAPQAPAHLDGVHHVRRLLGRVGDLHHEIGFRDGHARFLAERQLLLERVLVAEADVGGPLRGGRLDRASCEGGGSAIGENFHFSSGVRG